MTMLGMGWGGMVLTNKTHKGTGGPKDRAPGRGSLVAPVGYYTEPGESSTNDLGREQGGAHTMQ